MVLSLEMAYLAGMFCLASHANINEFKVKNIQNYHMFPHKVLKSQLQQNSCHYVSTFTVTAFFFFQKEMNALCELMLTTGKCESYLILDRGKL